MQPKLHVKGNNDLENNFIKDDAVNCETLHMPHSHRHVNTADRLVSQLNQSKWGKIQSTCKICKCVVYSSRSFFAE